MAGQRENVAIFNPLVLPLPNWHPDGPDSTIDGFRIPFVSPASGRSVSVDELAGDSDNRDARIDVKLDAVLGWTATTENVNAWRSYTAAQARALAGAWIRAAEILENCASAKAAADVEPQGDEHIVDAEIVEDDEPTGHVSEDVCDDNDCKLHETYRRHGCPACSAGTCTLHDGGLRAFEQEKRP